MRADDIPQYKLDQTSCMDIMQNMDLFAKYPDAVPIGWGWIDKEPVLNFIVISEFGAGMDGTHGISFKEDVIIN